MKTKKRAFCNKYAWAFLILFLSVCAGAQLPRYNRIVSPVEYSYIRPINGFVLPKYPSNPAGTWESGSKYFNTTDTSEYVYTGTTWVKLSTSSTFEERLPSGGAYQYIRANKTIANFQSDAYYALRGIYFPVDSTFGVEKINNFGLAVKEQLRGVGRIVYADGVIGLDTTGLGAGGSAPPVAPVEVLGRAEGGGLGTPQRVKLRSGFRQEADSIISGISYSARISGGVTGTGDKTSALQTLADNTTQGTILLDEKQSYTINGTLDLKGKRLRLENGAYLSGSGTITNGYIDAEPGYNVFATTLTVTAVKNQVIHAEWFGCKASTTLFGAVVTDNLLPFKKALQAAKQYVLAGVYQYGATIEFDNANPNFVYTFSDSILVDQNIHIRGQGKYLTLLNFAFGKKGFYLKYPIGGLGAEHIALSDFSLYSGTGYGPLTYADGKTDGVYSETNVELHRVGVFGFQNDGIHIKATYPNGNANLSVVDECDGSQNSYAGLHLEGADANVIKVNGGNYNSNAVCSVLGAEFLGGVSTGIHSASNTKVPYNRSLVTVGGNRYRAVKTHTNKQPTVATDWADYWELDGPGGTLGSGSTAIIRTWSADSTYLAGGGLIVTNANSQTLLLGPYNEPDQAVGTAEGTAALVVGGMASGMRGNTIGGSLEGLLLKPAITLKNRYEDTKYSRLEPDFYGWHNGSYKFGMKYFPNFHFVALGSVNNLTTSGTYIADADYNVNIAAGGIIASKIWFYNGTNERGFSTTLSTTPPTGTYAAEDYVKYVGNADTSLIGFRKTSTGWITERTVAGSGGGGISYTNGYGLNLSAATFSVDTTLIQKKMSAGTGIAISGNTIYATGGGSFTETDPNSVHLTGDQTAAGNKSWSGESYFSNGIRQVGPSLLRIENNGSSAPSGSTGVGHEIFVAGGASYLTSYNRSTSANAPIRIGGSVVYLDGTTNLSSTPSTGSSSDKPLVRASDGTVKQIDQPVAAYANYFDGTSQTFASSTVPSVVALATTNVQSGIAVSSGEITFTNAGVYEVHYSANASATGSANLEIRMQKWNGSSWDNITGTKIAFSMASGLGIHNASNTYIFTAAAGDKIRFGGTSTDNTLISLVSGNTDYSFSTSIKKL